MKTRKGEDLKFGASNFVRADYVEMRLQKLEERINKLERMIESFTRPPFAPRTIR
ncbi:MAG: hypothetical protein WC488_01345 [Candidatus Micrarchaeia archaeon]